MNDNAISNDSTIKIHQIIMYSNKVIHYLLRIITHSPHCQVVPDCDRHCRSSGELASISGSGAILAPRTIHIINHTERIATISINSI